MVVQFVPSLEVWTWKARAYAASQFRTTRLMLCVAPRSTRNHCGSLNALDQRVPVLPSTAALAGKLAFSVLEAVAGRPCESRVSAALAAPPTTAAETATRSARTAPTASVTGRGRRLGMA